MKRLQIQLQEKGLLADLFWGVFGLSWSCTFAYMATMLGVVFSMAGTQLALAMLILAAFAIGHCSVLVFAGTFTEVVQHYLHWSEKSKGAVILKKVCGVLVILGGVYLIFLNFLQ
jgi:cytochrome c-type biogenesis protein